MNNHFGYDSNKDSKETTNIRNSYIKKLKTTQTEIKIASSRDKDGTFGPTIVPKRKRYISYYR